MYHAELGRFMTRDPLPQEGDPDLLYDNNGFGAWLDLMKNLYGYADSNPLNLVDPIGLKCCGPDVTDWLVAQMNANIKHPVIHNLRNIRWPLFIPFFNLGWIAGFMNDFKNLVKKDGPWDFKSNQTFKVDGCPCDGCTETITLCGICFFNDVPGNIHYGFVAYVATLREWVIYSGGDWAAPGFADAPGDKNAIRIGIDMAKFGKGLCELVKDREKLLHKFHTDGCDPCEKRYG